MWIDWTRSFLNYVVKLCEEYIYLSGILFVVQIDSGCHYLSAWLQIASGSWQDSDSSDNLDTVILYSKSHEAPDHILLHDSSESVQSPLSRLDSELMLLYTRS
jgi:hypothetical protein